MDTDGISPTKYANKNNNSHGAGKKNKKCSSEKNKESCNGCENQIGYSFASLLFLPSSLFLSFVILLSIFGLFLGSPIFERGWTFGACTDKVTMGGDIQRPNRAHMIRSPPHWQTIPNEAAEASASIVLRCEALQSLLDRHAVFASVLQHKVDDIVEIDERRVVFRGLICRAKVVLDKDSVAGVQFAAVGLIIDDDNTIHVSTEETEVLCVGVWVVEPLVVTVNQVIKDDAAAVELFYDWGGSVASRRGPQHNLDTV